MATKKGSTDFSIFLDTLSKATRPEPGPSESADPPTRILRALVEGPKSPADLVGASGLSQDLNTFLKAVERCEALGLIGSSDVGGKKMFALTDEGRATLLRLNQPAPSFKTS